MKIGFIGAGKMGYTLGKHISLYDRKCKEQGVRSLGCVVGYYSSNIDSAKDAAKFTDTDYFSDYADMIGLCDAIFLTVPDGVIADMVYKLSRLGSLLDGKIICHTSGALSSQVFSGMDSHVYGYSIHPIYAVNSKYDSYKQFDKCFITLEGHDKYLEQFKELFEVLGHSTRVISDRDKVKYHASCVFSSNLVVSLYNMATKLLMDCGFKQNEAECALIPLFENNSKNIVSYGCEKALTGPVARCDIKTVEKHLNCLNKNELAVYKLLSENLIELCKKKCREDKLTDYEMLRKMLNKE